MKFNKTKPIALGIAFTLALTPIHAITYADTNSDSASINVQTAQTEYKSGFVFTKSSYAYRKGTDLTVCVSKSNLSVACDSYKLFYISDGSETAIDRNSYTISALGDAVYFTLSTNWLSQYSPQNIDITAIAYNGTAEVSKTNAKLVSEDGFDIDFAAGTVCVNQTENIRTNGQGKLTQDARSQAGRKKYIYVVDSVISQDESIIKISNAGNEWKYTGMKPGKTKLTVRYHYYYGKEKCTGEKTAEYEVVPATYTLDEERGSTGMLINRGASYTCNLRTKQTTYDKSGKAVSKYVDNVASNMLEKAAKKGASPQELQELATKVAKGDGSKASKVVGKIADYTDNGIVGRARDLVSSAKDKIKSFIPGSAKEAAESGAEKAAGNAAKAVAKETGEEATKSTLKSVTKKAAKESGKSGGFLKKILVKAKDAIEKLLENSTVKKKLIAVAESLGQTATAQWLKGIKESIQKVFDEAIEKGIKKVGADTCKKVLSKALAIVFLVTDFITGADQAESILGVNKTSLVEEFIAGLINALCNFLIIPSIIPGTSWIAQHLFKIFGKDLTERQKEADKDYEEYKEKNGSTLSKEEYLKRKHSVTGKIGGAISDTFGKIGSGIKKGAGKIADKAKEAVSNVKNLAGKAKKKLIGYPDSVTDEELAQYNAEHGTTYTKEQYAYYVKSFVGKTASKINTAIRNPKETLSNLKDKAWDLLGNAKDSISSTIKEINKIKEKSDSVITKAEDGKISPFSKQYWNIKSSNKGIAGALESVYGIFQRITKLPFVMISNVFNSVKSWFGKIRDKLVKKFGGIGDFIKDPIGSVKSLLGKGKGNSSSSDSDNTKKSNSVVDKLKSVGSGIKSFFGMGYDKQIDPSIANIRFNAPGDTQYQTIGDSGCGPAAAVSAIKSAYGRGSNDIVSASKYAVSNGYKEKNGGTKPQFFKDYFNKQGLTSSTTSNKSALMNNIKAGRPTVLMGTDSKGVNPNNPFGTNPHYVTVTGMDGRGNAIVQDPESKKDNQLYKINNLLSKSSFGVSVTGRNKSRFGRSKYGKGLRGSCTNEQAYNFFIDNGFTAAAAAGAVGNLMAEAGTDSSGQIDASSIESNGEGVGIVQWSYGRKQEFLQYCKDNGNPFPNKDLSLQLGFIIKELNGGEWRKYNGYRF